MWIRTQNKQLLIDVKSVHVGIHASQHVISTETECYAEGEFSILGIYKSKERALEVLDMIQTRIIKGTTFDYINNSKRTTKEFVFQMPEE